MWLWAEAGAQGEPQRGLDCLVLFLSQQSLPSQFLMIPHPLLSSISAVSLSPHQPSRQPAECHLYCIIEVLGEAAGA